MLRKEMLSAEKSKSSNNRKNYQANSQDDKLWQALRALRKSISDAHNIPPYTVFHDAALMEMVERQPTNLAEFATIHGVGDKKLANYGEEFIEVILEHIGAETGTHSNEEETPAQEEKAPSIRITMELMQRGMKPEDIAVERQLKPTTVYQHLAQLITEGLLMLDEAIEISEEDFHLITDTWLSLSEEDQTKLKPLHTALDGAFSYEVLGCVKAALELEMA